MNLAEVKARAWEKEDNFWSEKVMRPLSYYPAWFCIRLGISANAVTILNFIVGMSGIGLLASGGYARMVAGASLLLLNYFLDRVDGGIARATSGESAFGKYLDSLSDYVVDITMPLALGFGLSHSGLLLLEPEVCIYLGVGYAAFRMVRRQATLLSQSIFKIEPISAVGGNPIVKLGTSLLYLEGLLLFAAVVAGGGEFFLMAFTAVAFAEMVGFLYISFRGGGSGTG